ncbi:uncharacterized protein CG13380 [Armigeres subalbatus]|uniref:uncharacterized protein CG13380 n=1 Tax=Armigeres subalbatus TaxID=124917 RepID=UPI002ED603A5
MKKSNHRPPSKQSTLANRLTEAASYNPSCICKRPKTKIVCDLCNFASYGRVLRPCVAHPNVFYLMDFQHCPKCRQSYRFLKEVPENGNQSGLTNIKLGKRV